MRSLYQIEGTVIFGENRGKKLGFPTANVHLIKKIPEGIYASEIIVNGTKHSAATFIGIPKTFTEAGYKAESYILDFDENIYGTVIIVKLLKKIRGNQKFSSEAALINQMKKDVLQIRKFFNKTL